MRFQNASNITDIHITEDGKWVILGDYIYWSAGLPQGCIDAINAECNEYDKINCISFNDYGDWTVIGEKTFYASSAVLNQINIAKDAYGFVEYVNVTNDAFLVVCSNGYRSSIGFDAPIMKKLSSALDTINFTPKIVKLFYDGSYFIGSQDVNRWIAEF